MKKKSLFKLFLKTNWVDMRNHFQHLRCVKMKTKKDT